MSGWVLQPLWRAWQDGVRLSLRELLLALVQREGSSTWSSETKEAWNVLLDVGSVHGPVHIMSEHFWDLSTENVPSGPLSSENGSTLSADASCTVPGFDPQLETFSATEKTALKQTCGLLGHKLAGQFAVVFFRRLIELSPTARIAMEVKHRLGTRRGRAS